MNKNKNEIRVISKNDNTVYRIKFNQDGIYIVCTFF